MRTLHISLLFLLVITTGCNTVSADSLKIALLSDIHFLSPKLYDSGEAFTTYEQVTGRQFDDQEMVLEHVWSILRRERPDLLLISGDLTHHVSDRVTLIWLQICFSRKEVSVCLWCPEIMTSTSPMLSLTEAIKASG